MDVVTAVFISVSSLLFLCITLHSLIDINTRQHNWPKVSVWCFVCVCYFSYKNVKNCSPPNLAYAL